MSRTRFPYLAGLVAATVVTFSTFLAKAQQAAPPDVPYPVEVVVNGVVEIGAVGQATPYWDGSIVDLIAADAWAQCASNITSGADQANDPYQSYLAGLMMAAQCGNTDTSSPDPNFAVNCPNPSNCSVPVTWALQRMTAACNENTSTGQNEAISFYSNLNMGHALPDPSSFTDVNAASSTLLDQAVNSAQFEIDVADIDLCMAQRLDEYFASADSLFLAGDDLRELLEVMRERAQLAMLQHALLGLAFANPEDMTSNTVTDPDQIFPVLESVAKSGYLDFGSMGADFAAAVNLQINATTELANVLVRSAAARVDRGGNATTIPQEQWGAGSWRQRLLALFYGQNPLTPANETGEFDLGLATTSPQLGPGSAGTSYGTPVPWSIYWTLGSPVEAFDWPDSLTPLVPSIPYSTTGIVAPQVSELLGLARNADALLFEEADTTYVAPAGYGCTLTLPFGRVDVADSASELYELVEAYLRGQACTAAGGTSCNILPNDPSVPPISSYESSLLWTNYGITPDHATTLVQSLADSMERFQVPDSFYTAYYLAYEDGAFNGSSACPPAPPSTEVEGMAHVTGANSILQGSALTARIPGASGKWWHLDRNFATFPSQPAERAPLFTTSVPYWIPTSFDEWIVGRAQGFDEANANGQFQGAVSALSATRELLENSVQDASQSSNRSGLTSTYFAQSSTVLTAIDAAIGTAGLTVRPTTVSTQLFSEPFGACSAWQSIDDSSSGATCSMPVQQSSSDGSTATWQIAVRTTDTDPFFSGNPVSLVVVPGGGLEVTAAISPTFTSFGAETSASYLNSSQTVVGQLVSQTTTEPHVVVRTYSVTLPTAPSLYASSAAALVAPISGTDQAQYAAVPMTYSVFLTQTTSSNVSEYELLARHLTLSTSGGQEALDSSGSNNATLYFPVDGQYLAYAGSLGTIAARAWTSLSYDPSRPAYDGFDQPSDWVPPTDPSLYGGTAGTNAASYYLGNAQTAASNATMAVQSAISELLDEETDTATAEAARVKAAGIDALNAQAQCGTVNPQCDTSSVTVSFVPTVNCTNSSDQLCAGLQTAVNQLAPQNFTLATEVYQHINDSSPPSFSDYAGGTLQKVMQDQWQAANGLLSTVKAAIAGEAAQWAQVAAAQAVVSQASKTDAFDCGSSTFNEALYAGFSYGDQQGQAPNPSFTNNNYYAPVSGTWNGSGSWSPSALVAARSACQQAQLSMSAPQAQAAATIASAWSWLADEQSTLLAATAALVSASGELAQALSNTQIAQAQNQLDTALATANLTTEFGTYIRFHSYDVWRAQALLDSSRQFASSARHAIEAQYVVNLTSLTANEAYVASPSTWADDVYQYDLSAPSAVGLSAAPTMTNAIYPNQVVDYVGNLNDFVSGFAVTRPTAVADQDDEVITLPGPNQVLASTGAQGSSDGGEDAESTVGGGGAAAAQQLLDGNTGMWQFQCPGSTTWIGPPGLNSATPNASISTICGGVTPALATVSFSLDPWGRLNGDVANPPFQRRENVRWVSLAVNLVGTGIRNCAVATDTSECYSDSFVQYNLQQVGTAWITDYNEQWNALGQPNGYIEGGKALAAEQWLDPVSNGFNEPYVAAVARSEFTDRAFGGEYQLVLELTPDVELANLEQVQILTRSTYWVNEQ